MFVSQQSENYMVRKRYDGKGYLRLLVFWICCSFGWLAAVGDPDHQSKTPVRRLMGYEL